MRYRQKVVIKCKDCGMKFEHFTTQVARVKSCCGDCLYTRLLKGQAKRKLCQK